jgi:hypothetical protein
MKGCGRSNNAMGLVYASQRHLFSSRWLERRSLILRAVYTLAAAALASSAEPVFAANRAGSFARSLLDTVVRASSTGIRSDSSANPPPPGLEVVAFDSVERQSTGAAPTTTEIPPAVPVMAPTPAAPAVNGVAVPAQQAGADYDDGIIRYEHAKDADISGPPVGSLDDFMSEGDITSPLGFEVREDKRQLKSGGEAQGLLIMDVFAGTPAARAGLHPYHRAVRDVLETAAVAGALFVPPVVLLVPVFDQVRLGESYDLIIGVDGSRVANFLDFQDRLRDLQPGEIVYFSIVRNGQRIQIAVPIPNNFTTPAF